MTTTTTPSQALVDKVKEINEQWLSDHPYEIIIHFEYGEFDDQFVGILRNKKTNSLIPDFSIPLDVSIPNYFYAASMRILDKGIEIGTVCGVQAVIKLQATESKKKTIEGLHAYVSRPVYKTLKETL